ncbi:MAG: hypothetical protein WKF73_05810 [Nocardioidaceae bacterium]
MRGHPAPDVGKDNRAITGSWWQRIMRYLAGSVVATVCSEAAFLLLYGALEATSQRLTRWSDRL